MRIHKKHGVLCAGINGYKVYIINGHYRIVARYQFKDVYAEHSQIVSDYLNLKYQSLDRREKIIQDFLKLTEDIFI